MADNGQPLDDIPDVLLVRKHLVEFLGPPQEVFEVSGSPLPNSPVQSLNLAYFCPQGREAPVIFATCGASLFTMKDGRRVEGIIILRHEPDGDAFDAVQRLLASFALYAESNNEVIGIGDVVRAPDELQQFCEMDAVLFLPPIPFVPEFHEIKLSNEGSAEIVWILPVYEEEANYALAHGPQALMMLFSAQSLDLTDTARGDANTLIDPSDAQDMAKRVTEENQQKAEQEGPKPQTPSGPTKTSRRQMGKGSFEVEEAGGAVKVSRRGKKKVDPPAPPQRAGGEPVQRRKPARRPVVKPPQEEGIRFNLDTGEETTARPRRQPIVTGRKRPGAPMPQERAESVAPPPEPEPEPEPELSPEEAKAKRIAELKAKAQEAKERAEARARGEQTSAPVEEPEPVPEAESAKKTAQKLASKRRGALSRKAAGRVKPRRKKPPPR